MRTLSSILVATLLGLSATAFAAEPATREARMAEATKNYEAQKATTKATPAPAASKATVAKRPHAKKHAMKKHAAKKHAAKKHAKAATGASAPVSVKAAPAAVK